jgi:hypothetical protein
MHSQKQASHSSSLLFVVGEATSNVKDKESRYRGCKRRLSRPLSTVLTRHAPCLQIDDRHLPLCRDSQGTAQVYHHVQPKVQP